MIYFVCDESPLKNSYQRVVGRGGDGMGRGGAIDENNTKYVCVNNIANPIHVCLNTEKISSRQSIIMSLHDYRPENMVRKTKILKTT